jgi:pteridine reductase
MSRPVAFVTGGAQRIGAAICRHLHAAGYDLVIHFNTSERAATALAHDLETTRQGSATTLQLDLEEACDWDRAVDHCTQTFGRLDLLVNNASHYFPTPFGTTSSAEWDALLGCNLKAPYFLSQAAAPLLRDRLGSIINILDAHATRPIAGYPVYRVAKAALDALTESLALELAPDVRVNAIAPGFILLPEDDGNVETSNDLLGRIPLGRQGDPGGIAAAVLFLAQGAPYVTGEVITVDGGRKLT